MTWLFRRRLWRRITVPPWLQNYLAYSKNKFSFPGSIMPMFMLEWKYDATFMPVIIPDFQYLITHLSCVLFLFELEFHLKFVLKLWVCSGSSDVLNFEQILKPTTKISKGSCSCSSVWVCPLQVYLMSSNFVDAPFLLRFFFCFSVDFLSFCEVEINPLGGWYESALGVVERRCELLEMMSCTLLNLHL